MMTVPAPSPMTNERSRESLRRCRALLAAVYDDLAVAACADPAQSVFAQLATQTDEMRATINRALDGPSDSDD
jgi:hypothetical protein